MKYVLIFFGLVIVLALAGFFAGGAICQNRQKPAPKTYESKSEYATRSPDWQIQQRQNRAISGSVQRGKWAFYGGGIGAGAGAVLALIIIMLMDRKPKPAPPIRRTAPRPENQETAAILSDIATAAAAVEPPEPPATNEDRNEQSTS